MGEGTWPTLRSTLARIGVSETDSSAQCDAAFKQGARFARWTTGAADDFYYHPLMLPQSFAQLNLVPHWLARERRRAASATPCVRKGRSATTGSRPRPSPPPSSRRVANYAYHLDAGKFAPFLQRALLREARRAPRARRRAARRTSPRTATSAASTREQAGEIEGDLFVDCTGFKALLIGETLGVPFKDCGDVLFCDTALAVQVPYESDSGADRHATPFPRRSPPAGSGTSACPTRRGIGHVYSSRHISDEEAERELRAYLGPAGKDLPVRKIPIRAGHRETFWKRNCVAVGSRRDSSSRSKRRPSC